MSEGVSWARPVNSSGLSMTEFGRQHQDVTVQASRLLLHSWRQAAVLGPGPPEWSVPSCPQAQRCRNWPLPWTCARLRWRDERLDPAAPGPSGLRRRLDGQPPAKVSEYLVEENRVLKEQRGGSGLRLTDDQRRGLAASRNRPRLNRLRVCASTVLRSFATTLPSISAAA